MTEAAGPRVRVWDPLVRVLHWTLVLSFFAAWLTRHSRGGWHEWLGYAVLVVVACRLIWGFAGGRHARFAAFVRSPRSTLAYTLEFVHGRQPRYLGHNPLGAWMIVALLATVLAICLSGWLYTTDRLWGVEWVEILHSRLSDFGLVLVALHVSGVAVGSLHDRENLVAAMFHGRKRAPRPGDVA